MCTIDSYLFCFNFNTPKWNTFYEYMEIAWWFGFFHSPALRFYCCCCWVFCFYLSLQSYQITIQLCVNVELLLMSVPSFVVQFSSVFIKCINILPVNSVQYIQFVSILIIYLRLTYAKWKTNKKNRLFNL